MATSYTKLQAQIAQLQRQAEAAKRSEANGVIGRIKEAIATYGITSADLFSKASPAERKSGGQTAKAGYSDGKGQTWGGRGPRPAWLREALETGKALDDFLIPPAAHTGRATAKRRPQAATGKVAVKYRDGDNTWTGRGSQPRWLKAAIADGKTLDQFKV